MQPKVLAFYQVTFLLNAFFILTEAAISPQHQLIQEAVVAEPQLRTMDVSALLALRGKIDAILVGKRKDLESQLTPRRRSLRIGKPTQLSFQYADDEEPDIGKGL
jgi:hypothetical protein